MKHIFRNSILFFLALGALVSCKNDDDGPGITNSEDTIIQVAQRTTVLNSFQAAIAASDPSIATLLSGNESYTVFAPTDAAFTKMFALLGDYGFSSLEDFDTAEEKALLADILRLHVVSGVQASGDLTNGKVLTSLEGSTLPISVGGGNVTILDGRGGSAIESTTTVQGADLFARNGVIHFLDDVLLTEAVLDVLDIQPTTLQVLDFAEDFSLLKDALDKTSLLDFVTGTELTIFAPNNAAFEVLLNDLSTANKSFDSLGDFTQPVEIDLLSKVLRYHLVAGKQSIDTLALGETATILADSEFNVVSNGTNFSLRDETMMTVASLGESTNNINTTNSIIHGIDKVLQIDEVSEFVELVSLPNIVETAQSNSDLSILVEAIVKVNDSLKNSLVKILSGTNTEMKDGKVVDITPNFTYYNAATVFAPTNDAFEDLFERLGQNSSGNDFENINSFETMAEIQLLENLLLNHVLGQRVGSEDLSFGTVETLAPDSSIDVIEDPDSDMFALRDSEKNQNTNFVATDVVTRNGTVHVIDRVLLTTQAVDFVKANNE